jgi:hypothetical protein
LKEQTKKRNPPKAASTSNKPRAARGPKPSKTSAAPTPPGHGAACLRDAINKKAGEQSNAIAQTLIDKAIAGNMTSTRLVFEATGAKNAPPEPKMRRGPQPWVTRMCSEPELPGPWDEQRKRDASRLPPSDYDLPDDLK